MNERIRQLAEYATTEESDGWKYFDKEKFAELIVRECAKFTDYQEELFEHFGVEE
jgi:hypothetical protein